MPSNASKDEQIELLTDRLALALLLLQRRLHLGLVVLPSRERDRESLRGDTDYPAMLNVAKEIAGGKR
jgi:hypothetical protein